MSNEEFPGYKSAAPLSFDKRESTKRFKSAAKRLGLECDGESVWVKDEPWTARRIDPDLFRQVKFFYVADGHSAGVPDEMMALEDRITTRALTHEEYEELLDSGLPMHIDFSIPGVNMKRTSRDVSDISDAEMYRDALSNTFDREDSLREVLEDHVASAGKSKRQMPVSRDELDGYEEIGEVLV